jgi:hypothetical protein
MFGKLWRWLSSLGRAEPCAECGAPSVGFAAVITGKLLTKAPDGRPATKYYLGAPRPLCKKHLDEAHAAHCANSRRRRDEEQD